MLMLGLYPGQTRRSFSLIGLYYSSNMVLLWGGNPKITEKLNQSRHQSPQTLLKSLASGEHEVAKIPNNLLDFSQKRNWLFFCGVVYLTCTANFCPRPVPVSCWEDTGGTYLRTGIWGIPGRTGHLAAEKIIWRAQWEEETTKLETNLISQTPVKTPSGSCFPRKEYLK